MNTYLNSSFSKTRVLALAALLAGSSVAFADNSVPTFGLGSNVNYKVDNMPTFGGRAQVDDVAFMGSNQNKFGVTSLPLSTFASGANLRDAEVWSYGNFASNFSYAFKVTFANSQPDLFNVGASGSRLKEAVWVPIASVSYNCNNFKFSFGQFQQPFGMEWTAEQGDRLFMEVSNMSSTFLDRSQLGVSGYVKGEMFTLTGAVFQKPIAASAQNNILLPTGIFTATNPNYEANGKNDRLGASARVTVAPVHTESTAYHIGFNAMYKSLQTTDRVGNPTLALWNAGPELVSRQSGPVLFANSLNTSLGAASTTLASVRNYNTFGIELAGKWGPIHVQGEYMNLRANYQGAPNRNYNGWYAQAGWVFLGSAEGRTYNFDKGVFEKPVVNDGCYGAWELALGFSRIQLTNPNAMGRSAATAGTVLGANAAGNVLPANANAFGDAGSANSWRLGVNWYMNKNVAFQANYAQSNFKFQTAPNRKSNAVGVRAQFEF